MDPAATETINDLFRSYPPCQLQQQVRKQQVLDAFPMYVCEKTFSQWHLALYNFASVRPLLYVNHQVIQIARAFFTQHADLTIQALVDLPVQITHAVFSLLRPGSSWSNEKTLALGKPEHIFEFERIWHPEYQRYCEHVFNHLIRIPLFVLGSLKSKNYQNPALATRVGVLELNGLAALTGGFNPIVRNAISHGSIAFNLFDITYTDGGSTETLSAPGFSQLFDGLVDTCHAILVALLLFLCDHQSRLITTGLHTLPLGLRFLFTDAFASHEDFQLLSMIESTASQNRKQLNVMCKIGTRSRNFQLQEALNLCWNVCNFGGGGYDRFGVSFECGTLSNPFVFIDGKQLRDAINNNVPVNGDFSSIVESDMLWFRVPKVAEKIHLWKTILVLQWEISKRQFINNLRTQGFKRASSRYTIRDIENRSAASFRRILAHIVLHEDGLSTADYLDIVKSAVRKLHSYMVRSSDLQRETGIPGRPHYIAVRLYRHDKRIRTLASVGWNDANLVLVAEWFSKLKNNGPIFVKAPDTIVEAIRVQYNPLHLPQNKISP